MRCPSRGAKADICILDESPDRIGSNVLGLVVQPFDRSEKLAGKLFHVAIGHNKLARRRVRGPESSGR